MWDVSVWRVAASDVSGHTQRLTADWKLRQPQAVRRLPEQPGGDVQQAVAREGRRYQAKAEELWP